MGQGVAAPGRAPAPSSGATSFWGRERLVFRVWTDALQGARPFSLELPPRPPASGVTPSPVLTQHLPRLLPPTSWAAPRLSHHTCSPAPCPSPCTPLSVPEPGGLARGQRWNCQRFWPVLPVFRAQARPSPALGPSGSCPSPARMTKITEEQGRGWAGPCGRSCPLLSWAN